MTAGGWLAVLRARGILVTAVEDRLRVDAPRGILTPEVRRALVARRAEILAALRAAPAPIPPPLPVRADPASHPESSGVPPQWDAARVLRLVKARLRAVARVYPPESRLARTTEASMALAKLDAALALAIRAKDTAAVERALSEWSAWWHAAIRRWRVAIRSSRKPS